MNPIEEKRLLKLADELLHVPMKKFNMRSWFTSLIKPGSGDRSPKRLLQGPYDPECGTAACALGVAVPMFPRHLQFYGAYKGVGGSLRDFYYMEIRSVARPRLTGLKAAEYVFGITHFDAREIFLPALGNVTPKQVARTIRRVVKQVCKRQEQEKANA